MNRIKNLNTLLVVLLFGTQSFILHSHFRGGNNKFTELTVYEKCAIMDKLKCDNKVALIADQQQNGRINVIVRIPLNCCKPCIHKEIIRVQKLLGNHYGLAMDLSLSSKRDINILRQRFGLNDEIKIHSFSQNTFKLDGRGKPFYVIYSNNRIIDIFSSEIDKCRLEELLICYAQECIFSK